MCFIIHLSLFHLKLSWLIALLDDVSSVSKEKDVWKVIVKVVRLWLTPNFNGLKLPNSIELVLMEAKVRLQCCFKIVISIRFDVGLIFLCLSCSLTCSQSIGCKIHDTVRRTHVYSFDLC